MKFFKLAFIGFVALQAVGCAMVAEKTNTLNEDDVRRLSARSIGHEPDTVKVLSRSTEGANTYVTVQTKDGKQYACTINGGNYLSGFMVNPPQCNKK
jgi:hypothetical protein